MLRKVWRIFSRALDWVIGLRERIRAEAWMRLVRAMVSAQIAYLHAFEHVALGRCPLETMLMKRRPHTAQVAW